MKRAKVMSATARVRQQRRALRAELERGCALAERRLREAIEQGLIAGRIEEDGEIVLYDTAGMSPAPTRPAQ